MTPGLYTFGVNSDDGSEILVDGVIVADFDGGHGFNGAPVSTVGSVGTSILLTAGLHTFQVKFFQGGGGAGVLAMYQGADSAGQMIPIPAGALGTTLGTAGTLQVNSAAALGAGPIQLSNGVLQANATLNFNTPVAFTSGPLPVVLAGSAMNFNASNTLGSTASFNNLNAPAAGNATLAINTGTIVTLNGDLGGTSGLTLTNQPVVAGGTTNGGGTLAVKTRSPSGPRHWHRTLSVSGTGCSTRRPRIPFSSSTSSAKPPPNRQARRRRRGARSPSPSTATRPRRLRLTSH